MLFFRNDNFINTLKESLSSYEERIDELNQQMTEVEV